MTLRTVLSLAFVALSGCAVVHAPLPNPVLVHGIVTQPLATSWVRNFCGSNELVPRNDVRISKDCLPHGGEIYSVKLESAAHADGQALGRALRIGFPAHAIRPTYRKSHYLILQRASPDFLAAAGIEYVATIYDAYDATRKCFADGRYAHLDFRQCSDKNFHVQNIGQCVPEAEYLAHLAAGL